MYCNFCINYVENIAKDFDKITDSVAVENDDIIIVAVKTKPLFSKSEIDTTMNLLKQTIEYTTDKKVYLTRSMEVYCDIINMQNGMDITFEKILSKVEWGYYENVRHY